MKICWCSGWRLALHATCQFPHCQAFSNIARDQTLVCTWQCRCLTTDLTVGWPLTLLLLFPVLNMLKEMTTQVSLFPIALCGITSYLVCVPTDIHVAISSCLCRRNANTGILFPVSLWRFLLLSFYLISNCFNFWHMDMFCKGVDFSRLSLKCWGCL